jgi:pyruvate-formate lyase-activating enzyme
VCCHVAFALRLQRRGKTPFLINFELWNECNANCVFCRSARGEIYDQNPKGPGQPIPKGQLPFETYEGIIREVHDRLLMAVLYINGEPLLRKDLARAIRLATDLKTATMIATNGQLLTENKSREILEAGIDFVKIAISGFTQEVFRAQVRHGLIEKIKENIRAFVRLNREGRHGAVILIDFMIYEYNRHQLPDVRAFCDELGIMLNVRPGNITGMEDREPPKWKPELPLPIPCDWLWKILSVNWNGDLLPCCDYVVWSGSLPYATYRPDQPIFHRRDVERPRRAAECAGRTRPSAGRPSPSARCARAPAPPSSIKPASRPAPARYRWSDR